MVSVTFKGVGPGTCSWCQKEKNEVFAVAFEDASFKGRMCFPCFRNAARFKLLGADANRADRTGAAAGKDA